MSVKIWFVLSQYENIVPPKGEDPAHLPCLSLPATEWIFKPGQFSDPVYCAF